MNKTRCITIYPNCIYNCDNVDSQGGSFGDLQYPNTRGFGVSNDDYSEFGNTFNNSANMKNEPFAEPHITQHNQTTGIQTNDAINADEATTYKIIMSDHTNRISITIIIHKLPKEIIRLYFSKNNSLVFNLLKLKPKFHTLVQ